MPVSDTSISNSSQLGGFNILREGKTNFNLRISKGFTTSTSPVLLVTCTSQDGSDGLDPILVIEPEFLRARQTYGEKEYVDTDKSLKALLTPLQDDKFRAVISDAATQTFGSEMGWSLRGKKSDGTALTRPNHLRLRRKFKNNCHMATRSICTILMTMMMEENDRTEGNGHPGIRYVAPDKWKDLTSEGNHAEEIRKITSSKRAHEKSSVTAYKAMNKQKSELKILTGIKIYLRNEDGSLGWLTGEELPSDGEAADPGPSSHDEAGGQESDDSDSFWPQLTAEEEEYLQRHIDGE